VFRFAYYNITRAARHVIAIRIPMNRPIQLWAAIPRVDPDGFLFPLCHIERSRDISLNESERLDFAKVSPSEIQEISWTSQAAKPSAPRATLGRNDKGG